MPTTKQNIEQPERGPARLPRVSGRARKEIGSMRLMRHKVTGVPIRDRLAVAEALFSALKIHEDVRRAGVLEVLRGDHLLTPKNVAEYLRTTPLNDLGPEVAALSGNVVRTKRAGKGRVPKEVFGPLTAIASPYSCMEYVLQLVDAQGRSQGYLLKLRGGQGSTEQGWQGQFQIPGVTIVVPPNEDIVESNSRRLRGEFDIVRPDRWPAIMQRLKPVGTEYHDEPEREEGTVCKTDVYSAKVTTDDLLPLAGNQNWRLYKFETGVGGDAQVVNHHQDTLNWVGKPDGTRPLIKDFRKIGERRLRPGLEGK